MASVQAGGFTFSTNSIGGVWSWSVVANNIQGLGQQFQITDIMTPYGKFTDVVIPLPGAVVVEMANSITDLQDQLAPAVVLVSGTPDTYAATVTEGAAALIIAQVPFSNGGAFGSFLTMSATPGAPWITASPSSVVGIGKNQQAQITIGTLPALMLAADSPYSGTVVVEDVNNPSSSVSIDLDITVLPRPTISLSTATITLTYAITTGTPSGASSSVVTNSGLSGSILEFTAAKIQNQSPWLSFTPTSGGPLDSGDTSPVTFSLVTPNIPLIPGTYTEIVAITSRDATNSPQNITVSLVVSA